MRARKLNTVVGTFALLTIGWIVVCGFMDGWQYGILALLACCTVVAAVISASARSGETKE